MGGLEAAIARRDWELVALYLVLGVARAAARLPEGRADDLLAALAGERRRGEPWTSHRARQQRGEP